ncbi:MAG TPA: hypothetical protein VNG71_21700 [Pyrinomonadaceae bacterium]|nr:hypothetical protein [Pyrinomonadaceae bacterium]
MFLISDRQTLLMLARSTLLAVTLIFIGAQGARAQAPLPNSHSLPDASSNGRDNNKDKDKDDDHYGSPEAEMRAKAALKEEKKRYDEHVERAREVFQLANQVNKSYETRKEFSSEDQKRLERMEKLTKRIRNDSGGSDSDDDVDIRDIPPAMVDLIKKAVDWADQLKELVEKTPRQVVSAAVIDQANKLLGLVQHIRGTNH